MNILPYLVLGQLIFTITVHVCVTIPAVFMLFKYYLKSVHSVVLKIFLSYLVIFAFAAIINSIYLIIYWSPNGSIYNLQTLCLFGSISWGLQFPLYNLEFFLCLERCCAVILKQRFTRAFQNYLGFAALVGTTIFNVAGFWLDHLPIIAPSIPTTCQFYGCVLDTIKLFYYRILSIVNASTNIFITVTLLVLLKIVFKNQNIKEMQLYKSVVISILTTTCIQWFPNAFSNLSYFFLTTPITALLGPIRITIISLNVSLSSFIYFQAFRKAPKIKINNSKIVNILHNSK